MYRRCIQVYCITLPLTPNVMIKVVSLLILLVFWHKPFAGSVDVLIHMDTMSNNTTFHMSVLFSL